MLQQHATQRTDADIWASPQLERAITALRQATGELHDDGDVAELEAHARRRAWSDESLKETVQERSRRTCTPAYSDERLKETVQSFEGVKGAYSRVARQAASR